MFSFDIKGFLIFCFLGFLSFSPLPYTVCLGVFALKRITIASLKPPTLFLIGSGIWLVNHSYQGFLIGLIFLISFFSNLSMSSIDTTIGLENSYSISRLIFISLSFNSISFSSIKSFSNSKRLFFTFKNWFFYILSKYSLSIFLFL